MDASSPDYSPYAGDYARARPGYPPELFAYLAGVAPGRGLAWDCATGSGQAALGLAEHFDRVIATDASAEQIRHAAAHPKVEYRVAPAEDGGLEAGSADLVTAASAAHWFDLDAFAAEASRAGRPGCVLAVWTYHVGHVKPPFQRVFARFYEEVVRPYFAAGAKLVDARYETLKLPGTELAHPEFEVVADWNFDQVIDFIMSWSGTRKYLEVRGENPVDGIRGELAAAWGTAQESHSICWPLYLRARRL